MSVASSTTPGNRRELVEHAVDLHRGDRGAFNRREQHAAQRVADGRAEAALERLRVKPAEPIRQRLALELRAAWGAENLSRASVYPFANGPAVRPPDLQCDHRPPAAGLKGCGPVVATDCSCRSIVLRFERTLRPSIRTVYLLRVQLDDQLLLHGQVDLLARRQRHDSSRHARRHRT